MSDAIFFLSKKEKEKKHSTPCGHSIYEHDITKTSYLIPWMLSYLVVNVSILIIIITLKSLWIASWPLYFLNHNSLKNRYTYLLLATASNIGDFTVIVLPLMLLRLLFAMLPYVFCMKYCHYTHTHFCCKKCLF